MHQSANSGLDSRATAASTSSYSSMPASAPTFERSASASPTRSYVCPRGGAREANARRQTLGREDVASTFWSATEIRAAIAQNWERSRGESAAFASVRNPS
jgi:hypothetical protein